MTPIAYTLTDTGWAAAREAEQAIAHGHLQPLNDPERDAA